MIECPGSPPHAISLNTCYNPYICLKYKELISIILSIIESMQRSSNKQYTSVCNYKCSFDVKSQRELCINNNFQNFHDCIKYIIAYIHTSIENNYNYYNNNNNNTDNSKKTKVKAKDDESSGPVDIIHVFTQIIR